VTTRALSPDIALDCDADLGEGPAWDTARNCLLWVDITGCAVHAYNPVTGTDVMTEVGSHVGAAVPAEDGSVILALRDGIARLREDGTVQLVAGIEADRPENRFNDAKCDPAGRLWAGTMPYEDTPHAAALYRFDGVRLDTVLAGVTLSNGMDWSPDGKTMYYIDSATGAVDAFDFDAADGAVTRRRSVVRIDPRDGMPDGMTVDGDGNLWVAVWGSGQVRCYQPTGRLIRSVDVPATQVTSCAFGGPDGDQMYITTARYQLSEADLASQPHAGALFVADVGVSGPPATPFRCQPA
jgi:sugar lactone lactonase YvrE